MYNVAWSEVLSHCRRFCSYIKTSFTYGFEGLNCPCPCPDKQLKLFSSGILMVFLCEGWVAWVATMSTLVDLYCSWLNPGKIKVEKNVNPTCKYLGNSQSFICSLTTSLSPHRRRPQIYVADKMDPEDKFKPLY